MPSLTEMLRQGPFVDVQHAVLVDITQFPNATENVVRLEDAVGVRLTVSRAECLRAWT